MIFITGDTHGDWKNRFKPECFPIGQSLNRSDYVIVCGDFDKLKPDRLTDYLQEIQENIQYKGWYCGHMHENNRYKDDINVLYHNIIEIGGDAQ